jgi:hypothetical protein
MSCCHVDMSIVSTCSQYVSTTVAIFDTFIGHVDNVDRRNLIHNGTTNQLDAAIDDNLKELGYRA